MTPLHTFERLFFALFGLTRPEDLRMNPHVGDWTLEMFKIVFAVYLLVTVIVLINLLIAMMSDTYQRIQQDSDTEWKFGLAKLIRNMHRTDASPSPINLITTWSVYMYQTCQRQCKPRTNTVATRLTFLFAFREHEEEGEIQADEARCGRDDHIASERRR